MSSHQYGDMLINGGVVVNGNLTISGTELHSLARTVGLQPGLHSLPHHSPWSQIRHHLIQDPTIRSHSCLESHQRQDTVPELHSILEQGKMSLNTMAYTLKLLPHSVQLTRDQGGAISTLMDAASSSLSSLESALEDSDVETDSDIRGDTVHNGTVICLDEARRRRDEFTGLLARLHSLLRETELPQRMMLFQNVKLIRDLLLAQQCSSQNTVSDVSYRGSKNGKQLVHTRPRTFSTASNISTASTLGAQDSTDVFMSTYHGSCVRWCPCRCHKQSIALAARASPLLGSLLVFLSGGNFSFSLHDCKKCKAQQPLRLRLSYFSPEWLSNLVLHMVVTMESNTFAPRFQRRWSHMCAATSEIFKFAELGNIQGIQKLFGAYQARPDDIAASTGRTALHYAVVYNQKATVRFLLDQGADAGQEDKKRDTATSIAWERIYGKLANDEVSDAFRVLFTQDSDYFDTRNFTIFHKIVLGHNHSHLHEHLRLNEIVGLDAQDVDGRTALSWAAARGDAIMTEQLLDAGADPDIVGRDGRTPLHWAAQSTDFRTVTLLIEHKAEVNRLCKMKRTALHYAACNHNDRRYVDVLIENGAAINARDCHDRTPLGYATRKGHAETTRCLLESGADPTIADNWNYCPLVEAARASHHEVLGCLVELAGERLKWHTQTNQGAGILHVVAMHGNHETMKILGLERCESIAWIAEDHNGCTPRELVEARTDVCEKMKAAFRKFYPG